MIAGRLCRSHGEQLWFFGGCVGGGYGVEFVVGCG